MTFQNEVDEFIFIAKLWGIRTWMRHPTVSLYRNCVGGRRYRAYRCWKLQMVSIARQRWSEHLEANNGKVLRCVPGGHGGSAVALHDLQNEADELILVTNLTAV